MKAQLEANSWTQERINALFEEELEPSMEEMRGLFGPLSNIPIPPLAAFTASMLNQFPSFLLEPIIQQIGQQAFDELKAGARAPTGRELLALFEVIGSLEGLGEAAVTPAPGGAGH
ncbi:MAG: hypothetical protein V3U26_04570 [Dehalococcoidia bacterium]